MVRCQDIFEAFIDAIDAYKACKKGDTFNVAAKSRQASNKLEDLADAAKKEYYKKLERKK